MSLNFLRISCSLFLLLVFFSACQKEDIEIGSEADPVVLAKYDPIQSSLPLQDSNLNECFLIQYPIQGTTVLGEAVELTNDAELEKFLEEWEAEEERTDSELEPLIAFPFSVTLADGSIETIASYLDFDELLDTCEDDEHDCDDEDDHEFAECFEFVFPVTLVLPDGFSVGIDSLPMLEEEVDAWYDANPEAEDEDFSFEYPITVEFEDESTEEILSNEDLERIEEQCEEEEESAVPSSTNG